MKKSLVILFFSIPFFSQAQVSFLKQISSPIGGVGVVTFNDNSFIIGADPLVKMDSMGNVIWAKEFQVRDSADYDPAFLKTKDGTLLMYNRGNIVCTDTSGNLLWSKNYSIGSGNNFILKNLSADNGIMMIATNQDSSETRLALLKTDSSGSPVWCQSYGVDTMGIFPQSVIQTDDGGYLLDCQYNYSSVGLVAPIVIIKIDSQGNVLHSYNVPQGESYHGDFFKMSSNRYFLPGDGRFMCFDSTGSLVWNKVYSFGYYRSGIVASNGHLFFTGTASDSLFTSALSGSMAEIDTGGNILQCVRYTNYDSIGMDLIDTLAGGDFISVGGTFGGHGLVLRNGPGYVSPCYNYHLQIFDSVIHDPALPITIRTRTENVTVLITNPVLTPITLTDSLICDQNVEVPEMDNSQINFQIFPNPASSQFTVSSGQSSISSIAVFNMIGDKIYTAAFREPFSLRDQGRPSTVNCEHFPKGIYFVKVTTEKGTTVKKLIVD